MCLVIMGEGSLNEETISLVGLLSGEREQLWL